MATSKTVKVVSLLGIILTLVIGTAAILPKDIRTMYAGQGYDTCTKIGTIAWMCDNQFDSNHDGACFDVKMLPKTYKIADLVKLARASGESCLVVRKTSYVYDMWEVNGNPAPGESNLGFVTTKCAPPVKIGLYTYKMCKDNSVN